MRSNHAHHHSSDAAVAARMAPAPGRPTAFHHLAAGSPRRLGVILATVETSTTTSAAQQRAFWFIFAGWCMGVLGATITHYMYRR